MAHTPRYDAAAGRALRFASPLIAILALAGCEPPPEPGPSEEEAVRRLDEGPASPAEEPKVRLAELDAIVAAVEARRGQPAVVNVWATFCKPCIREMPVFVDLYKERRGDVGLVSISGDLPYEIEDTVKPFMKEQDIPFPVLVAEPTPDTIAEALDLPEWDGALPATFVLNEEGVVTHYWLEEVTAEQLNAALDEVRPAGAT
jgi:peroxiredoxin